MAAATCMAVALPEQRACAEPLQTSDPKRYSGDHSRSLAAGHVDKSASVASEAGAGSPLRAAVRNGVCDEVAAMVLSAFFAAHPDIAVSHPQTERVSLFRDVIDPGFSYPYARCRALAIIEPLVAEAQRFSAERGEHFDAYSVQVYVSSGLHIAQRPLELDARRFGSAVDFLENLAACHTDTEVLADLVRFEPDLNDLKISADRGMYLIRLADALGVATPGSIVPLPELWDAGDRAAIARIEQVFAENPVAEAVRRLPYQAEACKLVRSVTSELYAPGLGDSGVRSLSEQ